jgi:predicted Zn-dependent peptidase
MESKEPRVFELANGLRVSYLHSATIVSHLGVSILAGSRYELEGEEGLAHFLEHCIFKGTKKRRAFHVLSRLDSVGAELNAYTTKEEICIYSSFSQEHLHRAVELLADITFESTFPEKEIEKEKEIILDEINSYMDSPGDKIFDDFEAFLFPMHSLGNNILGTKESVQSFSRQDLLRYVERFFHPRNMVISYVGNSSEKKVLNYIEKYFGKYGSNAPITIPHPFSNYRSYKKVVYEANYQVHMMVGGIAPGLNDPKRRIMTLLINLLGGPALNSRLVLSVREKYGYSYNIEANYTPYQEIGYWNIYASTDQRFSKKTLKLIYKELAKLRDIQLTAHQLKQAKTQLKGHIALGMESNSGLMLNFGKSLLIFNQIDTITQIHDAIDAITSEEVQLMAQEYFDPKNMSEFIFDLKKSD